MPDTAIAHKETTTTNTTEPSKYKVLFLNDDVTPMEFVIDVLMNVFDHDLTASKEITIEVHTKGSGVAGIFPYEIAEQKGIETTHLARQSGYPLNVKIDPA